MGERQTLGICCLPLKKWWPGKGPVATVLGTVTFWYHMTLDVAAIAKHFVNQGKCPSQIVHFHQYWTGAAELFVTDVTDTVDIIQI